MDKFNHGAQVIDTLSAIMTQPRRQDQKDRSDALAATELLLAREQKLSALDGLAAAAAHELGTPLSTITLVTKELLREIPESSPLPLGNASRAVIAAVWPLSVFVSVRVFVPSGAEANTLILLSALPTAS